MIRLKKGFTLIELLAVIVILAVIALISTPLIMGTITKAKKNALKDTAYGILKAGQQYTAEKLLESENDYHGETIALPNNDKLQYRGGTNAIGEMRICSDGMIRIVVHDNQFCAMKDYDMSKVEVMDYNPETCKLWDPS